MRGRHALALTSPDRHASPLRPDRPKTSGNQGRREPAAPSTPHRAAPCSDADKRKPPACRRFQSGSDGTRTRDLRRDRPSQVRRRVATNVPERLHLQALSAVALRGSALLSQSSSRRLGHEWATKCCQSGQQIVVPRRAPAHSDRACWFSSHRLASDVRRGDCDLPRRRALRQSRSRALRHDEVPLRS